MWINRGKYSPPCNIGGSSGVGVFDENNYDNHMGLFPESLGLSVETARCP